MLWGTVLFMGFGLAIDPLRLGFVVAVLSRRRPIVNLLAYWLGGMAAGVGVGLAVLILMRNVALKATHSAVSTLADLRATVGIFTGGRLQITLGVVALLSVAGLSVYGRLRAARPARVSGHGDESAVAVEPRRPTLITRLGALTQNILKRDLIWSSFVFGLGSASPPVETLVLLTIIMASGAALGTQFGAFVVYTVIVLAVIEIPLVCYLAVPEKTQAGMLRLQNVVRIHRRRIFQIAITIAGVACLIQGMGSL